MTEVVPELLMPAGDPEKMKYAFAYGADAVYAGVPIFSLRARENGFRTESLKRAIDYAHSLNKKIYLTMNSFVHNNKIDSFLDSFCQMQDLNPDGFIMSGIGPIAKCLKRRPDAIIHLSTQANATNWTDVQFWRDLGIKRVVLSRELSLKEIAEIHDKVPDIELEAFIHGAICIAYSGRCLISNYLTNRDANEGTCTNSCRWEYKLGVEKGSLTETEAEKERLEKEYGPLANEYFVTEKLRTEEKFEIDEDENGTYLMNSKDLCAVELLKEIRDAGVMSFKVEGRSKSLFYVSMVARAYRRAIDDMVQGKPFDPEHLRELASTSNRTLMTGFYLRKPRHYGQNYADSHSLPLNHRYAGQVLEIFPERRRAKVLFKNGVSAGETIEWVTPTGIEVSKISTMELDDKSQVDKIHGGYVAEVDCPKDLGDYALLRQATTQVEAEMERESTSFEASLN